MSLLTLEEGDMIAVLQVIPRGFHIALSASIEEAVMQITSFDAEIYVVGDELKYDEKLLAEYVFWLQSKKRYIKVSSIIKRH